MLGSWYLSSTSTCLHLDTMRMRTFNSTRRWYGGMTTNRAGKRGRLSTNEDSSSAKGLQRMDRNSMGKGVKRAQRCRGEQWCRRAGIRVEESGVTCMRPKLGLSWFRHAVIHHARQT
jgi:hypothetical protein